MRSLIITAILIGLFVLETMAWNQFRQHAEVSTAGTNMALMLHCGAALAAAITGSFWLKKARPSSRVTLSILFFILAVVLPVGGVFIVAALAWILASPAGDGLRPEDSYVFGNPPAIAARHESRDKKVETRTLCEAMRTLNVDELESMIHGIRHLQPRRLVLHFLRRFQIDPQSNLQFASQGVITASMEQLESQLRTITARLTENPADVESHVAAAEVLLDLAAWTPDGDATAQVYREDALHHLSQVQQADPQNQRAWNLAAIAHLGLEEPRGAQAAISRLSDSDPTQLLRMQAEFLVGNFARLPELASRVESASFEYYDALGFWNGSMPTPAALLPRTS